jgi:ligand-binding sensor domain-containing protein
LTAWITIEDTSVSRGQGLPARVKLPKTHKTGQRLISNWVYIVCLLDLLRVSLLLNLITIRVLNRLTTTGIFLLLLAYANTMGQSINFSRLNTSSGLSDNNTRCITIDKNGFLWIGTNDGLNVYDGYTVTSFIKGKYPQMASDVVIHLLNDSYNRTWLGTYTGANWIDENRAFHRITIRDSITEFYCPTIIETAAWGVVVHTDKGQFYFDSTAHKWKELDWVPPFIANGNFIDAEPFTEDQIIYAMDTVVAILDYKTRKVIYRQSFVLPLSACPVSDTEIAVGIQTGRVSIINIVSGKVVSDYQLTNKLKDKTFNTYLTEVRRAANGDLLVATDFAGLIIIDKKGNITRHTHDPLKPGSISANNIFRSFAGKRGEIVVGSFTSGVNMANIFNKPAGYARIFKDDKGNLYDNYVTRIVEEGNGIFWVGAHDRLIRWNRKTNQSNFYYYYIEAPGGMRPLEIWALCKDQLGRLWLSAAGDGLSFFDKSSGRFIKIKQDTSMGKAVATPFINELRPMSDGAIWVGSGYGVYSIDPQTMKITPYADHPLLKQVNNTRVISLFEDKDQRIWIATWRSGAFCYDKRNNKITHFTTEEGLASNIAYGFTQDDAGSIYVATSQGFTIISGNGQLQTYNRKNGLHYNRCETLLKDDSGNIWISNNKSLVKFNPLTKRLTHYEENSGLSIDGFRANTATKAANGEILWGSESGINYFFPDKLVITPSLLQVSVYSVASKDTIQYFGSNKYLAFPYTNNDVTFHFTAINLNGSRNIEYQYKLEGYDKEWHSGIDVREARYPSRPAGNYTFHVKASRDRVNWTDANNEVSLYIVPPIWQRWWFIVLMVVLLAMIIHATYWLRLRQIREKEKMKAEYNQKIAEIEMKALRAQMNPHFIFNCLNSINRYIVKSDHTTASLYLTRFSKLIRLILDNSNSKNVLLSNEMEALRIYIEMESLRFNNKFTYNITLDKDVYPDCIEVPPLIIQPYVENAIWHGLLHKETSGHLDIHVSMLADNMLQCVIEDDGVGRDKAREYKSKSATNKKSLGMKLTEDRISILNKHASLNASITIVDLEAGNGEAAGTKVILKIPV